jgi:hypothetical protein
MVNILKELSQYSVSMTDTWRATLMPVGMGEKQTPSIITDGYIALSPEALVPKDYASRLINYDHVPCARSKFFKYQAYCQKEWAAADETRQIYPFLVDHEFPYTEFPIYYLKNEDGVFAYNAFKVYWAIKRMRARRISQFSFYHGDVKGTDIVLHEHPYLLANLVIKKYDRASALINPINPDIFILN